MAQPMMNRHHLAKKVRKIARMKRKKTATIQPAQESWSALRKRTPTAVQIPRGAR